MIQKAYFAMGCFWGPDEFFSKLPGVIETRVGYSGGEKTNPTYNDLGDNSETIEITFDAEKIKYDDLVGYFFSEHNPKTDETTRYRSIIFYANEKQKEIAEMIKQEKEKELGKITTIIKPFEKFYLAEEYHQKYFQKLNNLKK